MLGQIPLAAPLRSIPPVGSLAVHSPYDGQHLADVEQAAMAHVDRALQVAIDLYRNRDGWHAKHERIGILENTAKLMQRDFDRLVQLAASEGGKPYPDTVVEVKRAIASTRLAASAAAEDEGEVIPLNASALTAGRLAYTRPEPIGPVVAVSAFNHPLNLIAHQVMPAVAAGCPVIVKPADDTPLSCFALLELLHEAGLPQEWAIGLVTDTLTTAEKLVSDPRVAFFSFIGSAKVGWMLRSKLAPGTRCALEHGGAAPAIVTPNADLEKTIPALLKGGFYHAGQVCVSVQRVFAPTATAADIADRLANGASALKVGDPLHEATEVGPLIRAAEVERVHQWVQEAIEAGAELRCGGKILDQQCYAPTVLLNPPPDAKVSQLEIFGPVVCVYGYDDVQDAIDQSNSLPYAFQAAVFSQDIDEAQDICDRLHASAVMINDHTAFRADNMPFAGLNQSGLGIGGIPYTLHDMQMRKLIIMKS